MEIILNREDFLNAIKITEKITAQKTIQPILSNILLETVSKDKIAFSATDLNLSINYKISAKVIEEGKITLNARKISEIVSKLSSTDVNIKTSKETNNIRIKSGKTEFDLIGMDASEFPNVIDLKEEEDLKTISLSKNEFSKSIKQVLFAVAIQETQAVLCGACFNIEKNILELVATDGNRLTRTRKELNKTYDEPINSIIPSKTLSEVMRISSIIEDDILTVKIQKNKILFELKDLILQSSLVSGIYPKYQQLIPQNNNKIITVDRVELINAIERVAVMVNDRTNIIRFNFSSKQLEISTNNPEAGQSKDYIDIDYDGEDLLTAFNYKFVLDGLKNMDSKMVEIQISDVLAASIFKPKEDNNDYICLIMPVKVQ